MGSSKPGKSKGKQTRDFLKKGLLDGQIKARHKAREFKQKVEGRRVQRNKGGKNPKGVVEVEEVDSDEEFEKKRKEKKEEEDESDEEMKLDEVMGAEAMEDVSTISILFALRY